MCDFIREKEKDILHLTRLNTIVTSTVRVEKEAVESKRPRLVASKQKIIVNTFVNNLHSLMLRAQSY